MDKGKEYEVGYGKPPKTTRFKKGQSGNPKGRSGGTRNLKTDLVEELAERILIREGGRALKVSKQRALVKSLAAKALKGDTRSATLVLNLVWRILEKEPPAEPAVDLSVEDEAILTAFLRRQQPRSDGGGRGGARKARDGGSGGDEDSQIDEKGERT